MAVIAISGSTGAGKTVTAGRLAIKLGYGQFYTGAIFREMAAERGMPIEAFFHELASDPDLERSIDARQAEILATQGDIIIQGRLAPFIIKGKVPGLPLPHAPGISVLLTVSDTVGAHREANRPENAGKPIEEVARMRAARLADERKRYLDLYGIADHLDPREFDIILDTTELTEEEVAEIVHHKILERIKNISV